MDWVEWLNLQLLTVKKSICMNGFTVAKSLWVNFSTILSILYSSPPLSVECCFVFGIVRFFSSCGFNGKINFPCLFKLPQVFVQGSFQTQCFGQLDGLHYAFDGFNVDLSQFWHHVRSWIVCDTLINKNGMQLDGKHKHHNTAAI